MLYISISRKKKMLAFYVNFFLPFPWKWDTCHSVLKMENLVQPLINMFQEMSLKFAILLKSALFYSIFLGQYFALFFGNLASYNDIVGKSTLLLLLHPHQFLKYSIYISSIHKKWFLWSCKKFQNSRKTDPSFSRFGNSERSCDKTTTTFLKIQLTR